MTKTSKPKFRWIVRNKKGEYLKEGSIGYPTWSTDILDARVYKAKSPATAAANGANLGSRNDQYNAQYKGIPYVSPEAVAIPVTLTLVEAEADVSPVYLNIPDEIVEAPFPLCTDDIKEFAEVEPAVRHGCPIKDFMDEAQIFWMLSHVLHWCADRGYTENYFTSEEEEEYEE